MGSKGRQLAQAVACLNSGGIVCIPTESSYGLAVRADCAAALARLQKCKGRKASAPFGLIAADTAQVRTWTREWPRAAEDLASRFWPGPLTLIFAPASHVDSRLIGPSGGVGIRIPRHLGIRLAARSCQSLLTATSANPHGLAPATQISQAKQYFGGKVDFYWEEGDCDGLASTLVDFDPSGKPKCLRAGPIVLPESLGPW